MIAPNSGTVLLGNTLTFSATITKHLRHFRLLERSTISPAAPLKFGTISADGIFTAPADLPPGSKVQVTATSHADSSKSSVAGVTVSSDIAVSLSPVSSSVESVRCNPSTPALPAVASPISPSVGSLSGPPAQTTAAPSTPNGNYTAPPFSPPLPASPDRHQRR